MNAKLACYRNTKDKRIKLHLLIANIPENYVYSHCYKSRQLKQNFLEVQNTADRNCVLGVAKGLKAHIVLKFACQNLSNEEMNTLKSIQA